MSPFIDLDDGYTDEDCCACDGEGVDANPRAPHEATRCEHCNGVGLEPVQSHADYLADRADAQNDEAFLHGESA